MATIYWVGGTGTWDTSSTAHWSTSSGGAGGTAFPPSSAADSAVFDANSGSGTVTVNTISSTTASTVSFNNPNLVFSVTGPFAISSSFTLTAGSLSISTSSFTAASLLSNNSNTRSIDLGSSTVLLSGATAIDFTNSTGLTFTGGTSQINMSATAPVFNGGGKTFYNVSTTSTSITSLTITGANTFNNLTIAARTSASVNQVSIAGNQTISGTFTIGLSANSTIRVFLFSNITGTTRTLTCNAFASTSDVDFRDIAIAGSAAPITASGGANNAGFGNCLGNSGINFNAARNVYFRGTASANWGATTANWTTPTSGGTAAFSAFPLAQDTAIFPAATYPASAATITLNASYNVKTIDLSLRTTNTMTVAMGTAAFQIYGDLKTGTGITYTGGSTTNTIAFCGRTSQNITTFGKDFPRAISINAFGTTVTLLDAFNNTSLNNSSLISGTWNLNGYTTTLVANFSVSGTISRGITFGGATLNIGGSLATGNVWDATDPTNLTLDSTGTIRLDTGAGSKTFIGGGYQFYPTVTTSDNLTYQGLTITGSNKFITFNPTTASASPATGVLFTGGTTNEFTNFIFSGYITSPNPLKSTNTTQATLKKAGAWIMGPNSTNVVGNTGLTFSGGTAGVLDRLIVSYINGTVSSNNYTNSITEDAAVGDLSSTLYAYLASLYEDFSPADTSTNLVGFLSDQTENVTSDDSSTQLAALYQSQNEDVQPNDSSTQQAGYLSSITEDFSPADVATITVQIYVNRTEDFSPADISTLTAQFFVSQTEDTAVLDTQTSAAQLFESRTENFSPADVTSIALRISLSQTENITSADSAATVVQFLISQSEGFTPADAASTASSFFQNIAENINAADLATSVRGLFFALSENFSSADAQAAGLQFFQLVQENLNLQEFSGVPVAFNVSLVENVNMLDGPFVSGGWIKVDDTQSITWQNVSTPQTPTWTAVNDSQTPGWTPIVT